MRLRCLAVLLSLAQAGCGGDAEGGIAENEPSEPVDAGGRETGTWPRDDGSTSDQLVIMDDATGHDQEAVDGSQCSSASFQLTETQENFTIPGNVTYMHVKAWGAGGNGEGQCSFDDGGIGGYSEGVFAVTVGTELSVIVGQRGRAGMTGEDRIRFGFGDQGGGGLSGVFAGSDPLSAASGGRALLIAGGGGGASAPGCQPGGTGNHATAGGESTMQGGPGADGVNGGGGGHRGGTGGAKAVGGKGGKGFLSPDALDGRVLSVETGSGAPPKTDDPDYDGLAGKTERPGSVVIHFTCEHPLVR
jgi:hypothetical protein